MKKIFIGALAVAALLAGCNNSGGNEYVGKWVNVNSDQRTLQIERNGEGFMLRDTAPSFITGEIQTKNIPATLKDGALQVQLGGGAGSVTIAIDKSTGHLTNGQAEYKRVN